MYGIEFPETLLLFAAFMRQYPAERWPALVEPLGLTTTGPLGYVLRNSTPATARSQLPWCLHWRFFRDPPEFFSVLHGDSDGLHYGLLLDEPTAGFRGVASYFNNDREEIEVYDGLFAAVRAHVDGRMATTAEYLDEDAAAADAYRADLDALSHFQSALSAFAEEHDVAWDEGRPAGAPSDTGLGVVAPVSTRSGPIPVTPDGADVDALLDECRAQDPLPALVVGRSLWYWGGPRQTTTAHGLLTAAYEELGRNELLDVLNAHVPNRARTNVDLS